MRKRFNRYFTMLHFSYTNYYLYKSTIHTFWTFGFGYHNKPHHICLVKPQKITLIRWTIKSYGPAIMVYGAVVTFLVLQHLGWFWNWHLYPVPKKEHIKRKRKKKVYIYIFSKSERVMPNVTITEIDLYSISLILILSLIFLESEIRDSWAS